VSAAGSRSQDLGRRLWRLLRHDIGRKLTALAFALVLWTTLERQVVDDRFVPLDVKVVSTRDEADNKRPTTPAVYLVVPDELLVRSISKPRVTLQVKGIKGDVANLNMSAVIVFDATMLGSAGEKTFDYVLDRDLFKPAGSESPRLTDFRVKPETLSVTLASRLETDTTLGSLNVATEGSPKAGYFFQESRIVVRPNQVRLSGPSSAIAAISADPEQPRLAPVRLTGRSATVSQYVGLPQELLDQGVTLETPGHVVEVTIFLEAEDVTRELLSVPVTYKNEDVLKVRKQKVSSKDLTLTLDLKVTGPPSELDGLSNEELAKRIDLQYDWRDSTLSQARPKVRVLKDDLPRSVKVRLLADGDVEPFIEYRLEDVKESP